MQVLRIQKLTSGTLLMAPTREEESHSTAIEPPAYTSTEVLSSILSHCRKFARSILIVDQLKRCADPQEDELICYAVDNSEKRENVKMVEGVRCP